MSTEGIQQQPQTKSKFMRCKEILPELYFNNLSPAARSVYAQVWNKLNNYSSDSIWIVDRELIERSHIKPEQFGPAQSELSHYQLMEMTPGLVQTRYRCIDPDAEPGQSNGTI